MNGENKLWSDSLEAYKNFTRFTSESSEKMRDLIRKRFPNQSKTFDQMDKEALK